MRAPLLVCLLFLFVQSNEQLNHFTNAAAADTTKKIKANHWIYPVIACGYAGLTYLTYRHLDQKIKDAWQKNRSHFQTFISKSVTNLGLGKTQTIEIAATTIAAVALKNKKLERTVITWAGGSLLNSILTDQLKKTFQRHRPNTGDRYNVFDWRGGPNINNSFPSAHTSNAFTTATVFATIYSNHKWVPPVAYGLAALVGLSRIYDNAHWTSDVLTGAAIGFISAKTMNALYKWAGKKFTFLPYAANYHYGLELVYNLY